MERPCSTNPRITIGMPVYNGARTIAQAITSILNQTVEDWELLVVDDGSTDNTLEIAASFRDPRIVITSGRNRGLSARLNECIIRARGKFFARMDADDIAYPGRLQLQIKFLEGHANVDLVAGWVVTFRNDGTAFGARRSPLTHQQICAHPWKGMHLAHPTWVGTTEWFRHNLYREDTVWIQDRELLFRTYKNSRFATVPQIVLGYRENSLSLRKLLLTRLDIVKMAIRIAFEQHQYRSATLSVVSQAAKGLVDTIAVWSGLNYKILRHRALAIRPEEEADWRKVWEQVESSANVSQHLQGF